MPDTNHFLPRLPGVKRGHKGGQGIADWTKTRPRSSPKLLAEVTQRVLDQAGSTPQDIERALFETLYHERNRLESSHGVSSEERAFLEKIRSQAAKADDQERRALLRTLVESFAEEVAGHFDERVYSLATRMVPAVLNGMLNTLSPLRLLEQLRGHKGSIADQVRLLGYTDELVQAARQGTVVLVPTHSSNLDSILVGFALHRLGLPPFTYGAGLNLFANPVVGFFIGHLGAYTVDRRKTAPIYKDVLKTYACCTLEEGQHNLFFPGGTRSRSGSVEAKLKRGLLGTALDAYRNNLIRQAPRPDIFVVPCTINYQLVLEAETLIEDHLQAVGKARYIIEDDEFSRPKKILDFSTKLFSMHSTIDLVFGRPMDVFGNFVDTRGRSLDPKGRVIDRTRYLSRAGAIVTDQQRDRQYVSILADRIVEAYHENTVVKATNLVSYAAFRLLTEKLPDLDLYHVIRVEPAQRTFTMREFYRKVTEVLTETTRMAAQGKIRLDDSIASSDPVLVVAEGLAHLGTYHSRPALSRRGDRITLTDPKLALYYGNRLDGFGLPGLENR